MFRYFRALWLLVTGRFSAAAEALQSNKHVMTATYDRSLDRAAGRFQTVRDAVAKLMSIEQTRLTEIKTLGEKAETLGKVMNGAKVAMQRRINELKAQGKSKEEIQEDGDFLRHSAAYKDAVSSLNLTEEQIATKEADLEERRDMIDKYKIELQSMQRNQQALKEEKQEALADVTIAKEQQAISDVLNGIAADSTDKDLEAAREARKTAKAKAKIGAELSGNEARHAENEYLDLAFGSEADKELDALLDWGDQDTDSPRQDAQIPE